jgi:hypothetical protein
LKKLKDSDALIFKVNFKKKSKDSIFQLSVVKRGDDSNENSYLLLQSGVCATVNIECPETKSNYLNYILIDHLKHIDKSVTSIEAYSIPKKRARVPVTPQLQLFSSLVSMLSDHPIEVKREELLMRICLARLQISRKDLPVSG